MDNQTFELLIDRMKIIEHRICDIDKKVSDLLSFKWKLMGMATAVGFFGAFVMNIILKVI